MTNPKPPTKISPALSSPKIEPNKAAARDPALGSGCGDRGQRGEAYVDERDRHQLDAEHLSTLSWNQQHRRGRECGHSKPERDLSTSAEHGVADHGFQMQRHHDEDKSQKRGGRAEECDGEVVPNRRVVSRIHLRNMTNYRDALQCPGRDPWQTATLPQAVEEAHTSSSTSQLTALRPSHALG